MSASSPRPGCSRRGFLAGTVAGVAVGAPLAYLAGRHGPKFTSQPKPTPSPELAMPGKYRGRVIRVHNPAVIREDRSFDPELVEKMVHRGLVALVDGDPKDPKAAWSRFFEKDDVVGIKVNPVGRKRKPGDGTHGAAACISSPEVVIACVEGLKMAGVPAKNIIVFERYAEEFTDAEYDKLMACRVMDGVRWYAAAVRYTDTQLDIEGFDQGRDWCSIETARHVVGYDPDVFAHMGFCAPQHSTNDDRRFRSHLSIVVSRMVNKFINIPCLKDHRSAGVTLALKNMSHGMNNNVARSHVSGIAHGMMDSAYIGPNQCNTFIPHAVAQKPMRQKATLHILDGLVAVYEGGPGSWNRTWGTWDFNSLMFATDPVAMDHVGWDIIDRKRAEMGWAGVADMGLSKLTPAVRVGSEIASLASRSPYEAMTLGTSAKVMREGRRSEAFDLRTPQHVSLAGDLGLGDFERNKIDYRTLMV